jgi:hypothetical protein
LKLTFKNFYFFFKVSKRNNTEIESDHQKPKRRFIFSEEQKDQLMTAFKYDPYPAVNQMEILAGKLGLQTRTVINWFHNHRMRIRYKNTSNLNGQLNMSECNSSSLNISSNYTNQLIESIKSGNNKSSSSSNFPSSSYNNSNNNNGRDKNLVKNEMSSNFFNFGYKNSQDENDEREEDGGHIDEDEEGDYEEDEDEDINYDQRFKKENKNLNDYEMNEIMMNYEESQDEHDDEENVDEHASGGAFKTLEKDANESSNSEPLRYVNNNSDDIDQEAEINSLYISQNDEKLNDHDREEMNKNKSDENNDDGDDEDEENDDFETKNCKNDKYSSRKGTNDWGSCCKQQNNEENMLKSNKRRKPHNPQKLSTPEDLASSSGAKSDSLLRSEKNNDEQNNNLTDKE